MIKAYPHVREVAWCHPNLAAKETHTQEKRAHTHKLFVVFGSRWQRLQLVWWELGYTTPHCTPQSSNCTTQVQTAFQGLLLEATERSCSKNSNS